MNQPPYTPAHSFVSDSATLANFPGQALDVEFNAIAAVTSDIEGDLALIQRDDGELANGSVGYDQLSASLQTAGIAPAFAWVTATAYAVGNSVVQSASLYRCLIAHTSGVFATDLAAKKWLLIAALPGSIGNMVGPVSSVAGNVPKFHDTGGALIDDSGVALSALALLASPALTGTPTAPTATGTDSTTKLATTAFVAGNFGSLTFLAANYGGLASANSWSGSNTFSSVLTITNATATTSAATGALVITGGLGASGAIWGGNVALATSAGTLLNATASSATAPILRLDSSYGNFSSVATIDMTINGNPANIVCRIGYPINNADSSGDFTISPSSNFVGNNTAEVFRAKNNTTGKGILVSGQMLSNDPARGVGYATGAGGTVTQLTGRTTSVTLNKTSGAITLFAATAVVGTWISFTVTNSSVAATDVPVVAVKSGTNTYVALVSAVAAGSFQISFQSILGTASDSPVINFDILKGVTS